MSVGRVGDGLWLMVFLEGVQNRALQVRGQQCGVQCIAIPLLLGQ